MTNNEKLNSITGEMDTPEISAVKMLLARIEEDAEHGDYDGVGQHIFWISTDSRLKKW